MKINPTETVAVVPFTGSRTPVIRSHDINVRDGSATESFKNSREADLQKSRQKTLFEKGHIVDIYA